MTASKTTSPPLQFALFGPMQAFVQGAPFPTMRSRKGLWLLALLILKRSRPIERKWLAEALWPDADPVRASDNLRPILSDIRDGLGDQRGRLQSPNRQTLRLDLTDADVDVIAFDAAIKRGTRSDLAQAVALYRGPLLEGCTEEWAQEERRVREAQCLDALMTLGKAALTGGDNAEAIVCYQRAAGLDPWSDEAQRGWMEALDRSDDRNAALRVYQEFAQALKNDGGEPDEQTMALYKRLRAEARRQNRDGAGQTSTTAAPSSPSGSLPHFVSDLIGREDELLDIAAALRDSRLVTLTGAGGVGKTRLAIEAAREASRNYPDGAWMVALDSLAEGEQIPAQIAAVLGLAEKAGQSFQESLSDHLREKRILLVLDNCEHLRETSANIAGRLLRECAQVCILATSREALGIPEETAWATPSLPTPDLEHLPTQPTSLLRVAGGYDSVQLFVERAQAVRSEFALTAGNALSIASICARLDGIPLAIELAAARIKVMTAEQIDTRLHDTLALLTSGGRAALSRQQTLRGAIDWSYELLDDAERTLLRRLSVFAGGWTFEAAQSVCSSENTGAGEMRDRLNSLVEKSLALFEDDVHGGRYRFLEMVRQYAEERLEESREGEQIRAARYAWFLEFLKEAHAHLSGPDQNAWFNRLEADYANIRTAIDWGLREPAEGDSLLLLAGSLWIFWYRRNRCGEGRYYLDLALARPEAQALTSARALALYAAGSMAYNTDFTSAQSLYEEALVIQRQLDEMKNAAASLNNLGMLAFYQGDSSKARKLIGECLEIRRDPKYNLETASAISSLGMVCFRCGEYDEALRLYEESLTLNRQKDRIHNVTMLLNFMGEAYYALGDFARARAYYEENLANNQEWKFDHGKAVALQGLGSILTAQGDYEAAHALLEESLTLRREISDQRGSALSLQGLAQIAYASGKYVAAIQLHEESLTIRLQLKDQDGGACNFNGIAACLLAQGQAEEAVRLWAAEQEMRDQIGSRRFPVDQPAHDARLAQARLALGEDAFDAAWAQGRAVHWKQAAEFLLHGKTTEILNDATTH